MSHTSNTTYTFPSPAKLNLFLHVNGRRDDTNPFSLSVTTNGNVQTVRIAFTEFSGTSVIGANQEFSIPSGDLDIGSGCVGSVTYDGRFEGSSVSGSETGRFVCPDGFLINLDGTFEATLQTAKRLPFVNEFNFTR